MLLLWPRGCGILGRRKVCRPRRAEDTESLTWLFPLMMINNLVKPWEVFEWRGRAAIADESVLRGERATRDFVPRHVEG
jgi:hypothetical protein